MTPKEFKVLTLKQEETKEITRPAYTALSDVIKDWDENVE